MTDRQIYMEPVFQKLAIVIFQIGVEESYTKSSPICLWPGTHDSISLKMLDLNFRILRKNSCPFMIGKCYHILPIATPESTKLQFISEAEKSDAGMPFIMFLRAFYCHYPSRSRAEQKRPAAKWNSEAFQA